MFAVASCVAMGGEARAQGFFGPETATAWQPELDAYVLRAVPSPDQAKTHALDLRVGVIHDTTLTEGGSSPSASSTSSTPGSRPS